MYVWGNPRERERDRSVMKMETAGRKSGERTVRHEHESLQSLFMGSTQDHSYWVWDGSGIRAILRYPDPDPYPADP
ncbi:hypothetical protein F2Q69_00000148 [Brassica cretica]|uniref:Uncharacterized protein n=1 Tax=Brassica cretica TaxID=69181 RepID=A0A8S9NL88_BRACR|nr:hypothetical protein F2Q69_00000148 [Brassica cretica]